MFRVSGLCQICTEFFYQYGCQGDVVPVSGHAVMFRMNGTLRRKAYLRIRSRLTLHCDYAHSRGCEVPYFRTVSDMDVAPEPTRMCLWRVRKKGTSRPRRPCRLRDSMTLCQFERSRYCASCVKQRARLRQSRRTSMCSLAIYRSS